MSWIYYLLEANLYLACFYLLYHLILRSNTYYQLNRIYLLASSTFAFVIPLLQLGILKHPVPPPPPPAAPLMVLVQNQPLNMQALTPITAHLWRPEDYYLLGYGIIAVILLLNFGIKLYKLVNLSRRASIISNQPFKLVEIADDNNAFSFFNYLFIDPALRTSDAVIAHELVHIRQKHSWDIVYLELLKIINWFNPAVYLLQNSMKEVHEFIADQQTTINTQLDIDHYTAFLINNACGLPQTTLTNNLFNNNLLKRRIMMLHQKPSGYLARLKYLTAVPLFAGMLCASTLAFTKDYGWVDLAPYKIKLEGDAKPLDASKPQASSMKIAKELPPPPPPPTYVKYRYRHIANYLYLNTKYPDAAKKARLNATVAIDFNVDANGKLGNIAIAKSAGHDFDDAVLTAMKGYNYLLDFKPGTFRIGVDFMMQGSKNIPAVAADIKNKGNFIGEIIVPNEIKLVKFPPPIVKPDTPIVAKKVKPVKFPPPVVKADKTLPPPPPPAPPVSADKMPKPFGKTLPPPPPAPPVSADKIPAPGKLLPPPPPPVPPADADKTPAPAAAPANALPGADFEDFYKYIAKNVRYPAEAVEKKLVGHVFVIFTVSPEGNIENIKIARGLDVALNNEVIRVIQGYRFTKVDPAFGYVIPVTFSIQNKTTGAWVKGSKKELTSGETTIAITAPVNNNKPAKSYALNEVVIAGFAD